MESFVVCREKIPRLETRKFKEVKRCGTPRPSRNYSRRRNSCSFVGCSRRGKGVSRISARGWQLTRATCENRSRVRKWRPFLEKLDGWARGKTTTSCLCGKTCRGGLGPRRGDELAPFELQARGSIGTSRSPEKRREQHRDDDEDEGRRSEARAATVLHGRWILA